jgi:sugar phosphate isomerase/epimerase
VAGFLELVDTQNRLAFEVGIPVGPGEIAHVHFQDAPDMPREMLDQTSRFIPGDGVSPLTKTLRKLADKGYSGPLSVEVFLPKFQQGDPYEVAA